MRTWISQALTAGGILSVRSVKPGHTWLCARMDWPDEQPVTGHPSHTFEGAVDSLERALMADAAREMVEKGAV